MDDEPKFKVKSAPKAETEEEAYELERISNYAACFAGPAGAFVLKDLIRLVGLGGSIFRQVDFDQVQAANLDGAQSIVWRCINYSGKQILDL